MNIIESNATHLTPKRSFARRTFAFYLGLTLLCILSSGFCVTSFGTEHYNWQAFEIEVNMRPSLRGETHLILRPLGEVRARTHRTPMALNVSLQSLSVTKLETLISKPPSPKQLEVDFAKTVRHDLIDFSVRQIGWGILGGLIAPLFLRARQFRIWLWSAFVGGASIAVVLGTTAQSYNRQAFEDLTYVGSLRQAGPIIALTRSAFNNVEALSDKLRGVAGDLNTLYGRINAVPSLAPGVKTVRILHISDIHNNGAAVDFVRELADKFEVNAVIDTGDLTDFGTPVETRLTRNISQLKVPYLFTPGNHDSQITIAAVRRNSNAVILDGQVATVSGLHILGLPDPSSARPGLGSVDTSSEALAAQGTALLTDIKALPQVPDIVCVHNPRMAAPTIGLIPVLLCGHLHRASVEVQNNTVICNAGTTGGAGLRYFDRPNGVPLSAAILTFTVAPHPHLLFIDQVILDGSLNQYSISRQSFPVRTP